MTEYICIFIIVSLCARWIYSEGYKAGCRDLSEAVCKGVAKVCGITEEDDDE